MAIAAAAARRPCHRSPAITIGTRSKMRYRMIREDGPGASMVHPKVNTAGRAKSASHPHTSTGATTAEAVAEATPSGGKSAKPSKCSTEHSRGDGVVAEAIEATRVSERKRDRQIFDAGNDYHTGHHRVAYHRFHAGPHVAARRPSWRPSSWRPPFMAATISCRRPPPTRTRRPSGHSAFHQTRAAAEPAARSSF